MVCFLSLSLVLYPATLLSVPNVNGLVFVLFVVLGFFVLYRDRFHFNEFNRAEILVFVVVLSFFLSALLSMLIGGGGHKVLGKYVHVLLFIPIYIFLKKTYIKQGFLWFGLVSGAVVAALVASYDIWVLKVPRAHSFMNPILFSNLSLVLGCMAMTGVGWFKQRSNKLILLPVLALFCGIFVSILASTRGSWVALLFLIILFFWYVKSYFSIKKKIIAFVIIIVFFSSLYAEPRTKISYLVDKTISSLQQYSQSEITGKERRNSTGVRLEMWQASWQIFIDHPLVGAGWGNYTKLAQVQVDHGLRNKDVSTFNHPHSEYFFALAGGGVLGFIALISLFFVPGWIFINAIKQSISADIQRLALAGLVLIISFMVFGLTEPMLYRSRSVGFFSFYLAVFMAGIYQENKKVDSCIK